MQFLKLSVAVAFATGAFAAYVPDEPYSTLSPSASLSGGLTDYTTTFGIVVDPVATTSSSSGASQAAKVRRDAISQIGDGQVQATTATEPTSTAAAVVSQITDGQIQATTSTKKDASTAAVVSQIGDGQIQATTSTKKDASTAAVVSQIGDGQIQATTSTKSKATAASQIGDGQVQASTASEATGASQVSDGQVQSTSTASADSGVDLQSCRTSDSLAMTLKGSILTDSHGRIGSIVANRQFQFDGPPPQAGAIYAAGWSVSPDGYLAIGNSTIFYQCLSGSFYNLYDESIGAQCKPVKLQIADLIEC